MSAPKRKAAKSTSPGPKRGREPKSEYYRNRPRVEKRRGKDGRAVTEDHVGHPRMILDTEKLALLVTVGCTIREIAEVLGCSPEVIERNYMDTVKHARLLRNANIRRKQYQLAMDGNVGMLIWVGKQWLGQTDKFQLGEDEMHPFNGMSGGEGGGTRREIIFVESDGDGHPKRYASVEEMDEDPGVISTITPKLLN